MKNIDSNDFFMKGYCAEIEAVSSQIVERLKTLRSERHRTNFSSSAELSAGPPRPNFPASPADITVKALRLPRIVDRPLPSLRSHRGDRGCFRSLQQRQRDGARTPASPQSGADSKVECLRTGPQDRFDVAAQVATKRPAGKEAGHSIPRLRPAHRGISAIPKRSFGLI
jgi:hypothetical protein